jgi:hypothetical protein
MDIMDNTIAIDEELLGNIYNEEDMSFNEAVKQGLQLIRFL